MKRISQVLRVSLAALLTITVLLSIFPAAPLAAQAASVRYLVVAKADTLPDGLADQVTAAGGTISAVLPEVGIIAVESANPNFVATVSAIKEVQTVVPDVLVPWVSAEDVAAMGQNTSLTTFTGQATGANLPNYVPLQWNLAAIHAPEAWATGARGRGVRVAVLDAGFELSHPDFMWVDPTAGPVSNIDAASGVSFVPEEFLQFNSSLPVVSHATHVAGIIAAADNGFGVTGVAPEATIVPIKVLRDYDLQGDFTWIIQGIYYAANLQGDQAVDVINMSLGAAVFKNGWCDENGSCVGKKEIKELLDALKRAIKYADKQGITVVAAAGNTTPDDPTIDMDHVGDLLFIPADTKGAITVSATGPVGLAFNPSQDLDQPAFYSRYGKSYTDFTAPGGNSDVNFFLDFLYNGCQGGSPFCTPLAPGIPVGVLDWVWSTANLSFGGWLPMTGTSMASPHVAGVAALIIGQNGGSMKPDKVKEALKKSADDLDKLHAGDLYGKPDFYGDGRVNAFNAVK